MVLLRPWWRMRHLFKGFLTRHCSNDLSWLYNNIKIKIECCKLQPLLPNNFFYYLDSWLNETIKLKQFELCRLSFQFCAELKCTKATSVLLRQNSRTWFHGFNSPQNNCSVLLEIFRFRTFSLISLKSQTVELWKIPVRSSVYPVLDCLSFPYSEQII